MSDTSNNSQWTLKSIKPLTCPDILLPNLSAQDTVVIGREQLENCANCQFLSSQHCSFRYHPDGLFLKSLAKFDVISVNGTMLKKDEEVLVTDQTKIILCQKLFKYILCKVAIREHYEPQQQSLTTSSSSSSSSPAVNNKHHFQAPTGAPSAKKARISRADMFFEEELSQVPIISTSDANALNFDHIEYENRTREGVNMSLADIESSVCMRSQMALSTTKSLCRTLLSSFYCDICLEVIASCRSCVPCGHSYCAPCIQGVINAAGRFSTASCPKCRTEVTQVIPNKTVDAAISDCLTNIKEVSTTVKAMRMPAVVTESQDIGAWNDRYELNEAPTRPPPRVTVTAAAAQPAPRRIIATLPALRSTDLIRRMYENNGDDDDDEDDDDDDDDEDDEEDEYYNCTNALVELARSGRATCIHCHSLIGHGTIRFGIDQQVEYYEPTTKFIHLTCGAGFNSQRTERQSKIRFSSLHGLNTFSAAQKQQIRNALPGYP